jgi:hypothetical protein
MHGSGNGGIAEELTAPARHSDGREEETASSRKRKQTAKRRPQADRKQPPRSPILQGEEYACSRQQVDPKSSRKKRRCTDECARRRLRGRTVNRERTLIPANAAPSAVSFPFWSLALACVSRTEKPTPTPPFRRIPTSLRP